MLRALASAFFYTRFFHRFSTVGWRQRQTAFQPYSESLAGQVWLVTGASGGIGAAISTEAARRGATVLAMARNARTLEALGAALPPERWQPQAVDLSRMAAIRGWVTRQERPIDVLVNNVGVLLNDYRRTDEGLESSFASNLLGHYLLTEGLHAAGLLKPSGCVIEMSSGGAYGAKLVLDPMLYPDGAGYDGMAAYAMHKRAQLELVRHWNRRWPQGPRAYAMHPGWVDTDGVKSSLPWFRATLRAFLRTPAQGADTALWLGTTRPALTAEGCFWLDRVRDTEHAFGFTRQESPDAEALGAFLAAQAAAV
ncbi:MAG: SDR family NAD(P)-dependent oxidoreductase [Xanthomonadales bacterium]|jgi:dehydrogenase/reductase SDR family protein 12|nr:SDR family NAD(P)-dependent oxidoreductase [Xanthomonadales bacterium]